MISVVCSCRKCANHDHEKRSCKLKVVILDEDGSCGDRELTSEVAPENPDEADVVIDQ